MSNKVKKGQYNYLPVQKKREIIKTVVFFGISAAIFLMGLISTGTKMNYLTIVAVLGCLPAGKSLVSMIMNLRIQGCSAKCHERIADLYGEDTGVYNLYFTSYDKNYDISHILVKGVTVIAFTEISKIKEVDFEEHIKTILLHDSIKGYNVKLYKDLEKYLERMGQMLQLENEKGREEDVLKNLFAVSL